MKSLGGWSSFISDRDFFFFWKRNCAHSYLCPYRGKKLQVVGICKLGHSRSFIIFALYFQVETNDLRYLNY
jgi:hypothetical protein